MLFVKKRTLSLKSFIGKTSVLLTLLLISTFSFTQNQLQFCKLTTVGSLQGIDVNDPSDYVMGDFNEDDIPDIAVIDDLDDGTQELKIYTGNGISFSNTEILTFDYVVIFDIRLFDLDNDGDLDITLGGRTDEGGFRFFQNYVMNSNGNFSLGAVVKRDIIRPFFADIDGDNDLDMISRGTISGGIRYAFYVFENNELTLIEDSIKITDPQTTIENFEFVDLDNDGLTEVILSRSQSGINNLFEIYSFKGVGNGFEKIQNTPFEEFAVNSLDVGDIDGDGDLDLGLIGFRNASPFLTGAFIYLNDNLSFNQMDINLSQSTSGYFNFVDLNQDSYLDIFLQTKKSQSGEDSVKLYLNILNTSFTKINLELNNRTISDQVDFVDFDNDGILEINFAQTSQVFASDREYNVYALKNNLLIEVNRSLFRRNEDFGVIQRISYQDVNADGFLDFVVAQEGNFSPPRPGSLKYMLYNPNPITGDLDENCKIDENEITGDINRDRTIGEGEIAGDVNGDRQITSPEIAGDINGNGVIDGFELSGDVNGDSRLEEDEISGDINGDRQIISPEIAGDVNGNGVIDNSEIGGDVDGDFGLDENEIAGDINGDKQIVLPEIAGDLNVNGLIDGSEIAGDVDGNKQITSREIAGDLNGNGVIDGSEIAGDLDGDSKINERGEIAGDFNGDGILGSDEIAGDLNGNGIINIPEIAGDLNGNGEFDNSEFAGDIDGNGRLHEFNEKLGDINGNRIIDGIEVEGDSNGDGIVSEDEKVIPLSIFSKNEKTDHLFFPNPTQGMISSTKNYTQLEVTNLNGVSLIQMSNTNEVDLSNLPNGSYLIKTNEGSVKVVKN